MPVKYDNSSNGGGGDDAFLAGFLGGVMESGENVWSNLQRKRKEDRDYQLQVDKFEEDKKYAKTAEERAVAQDEYNKWVREQAKAKTAADEARNKTIQGREDTEWGWEVEDQANLQEDRAREEALRAEEDAASQAEKDAVNYAAGLPVQRPQLMQQYDEGVQQAEADAEMSGFALDAAAASPLSNAFGWANQEMADELKTRVARVYSNEAADRFSTVLAGVRQDAAIKVQNIAKQNPAAAASLAAAVEVEFVKIQDEMEKRVAKKEVDGFDKQPWANTEFGQSILEQVANARATGQDPREIVSLVNTRRQERAAQLSNLQRINTVRAAIERGIQFYTNQSGLSGAYAADRIAADNKGARLQALMIDLETANTDDLARIVKEYKEITGSTGLPGFDEQMKFGESMSKLSTETSSVDPVTNSPVTVKTPVFSPEEVRNYFLGVQAGNVGIPNPNPGSSDTVYNTRPAQESLGIPAMPNESGELGRWVGALSLNDRRKWSDAGRPLTWDGKPALPRSDGKVYLSGYVIAKDPDLNGGRLTLIPTVWGGRPVENREAVKNAIKYQQENDFQFYSPGAEGDKYNPNQARTDIAAKQKELEELERQEVENYKNPAAKEARRKAAQGGAQKQTPVTGQQSTAAPTPPAGEPKPTPQPQAKPQPQAAPQPVREAGSAKADFVATTLGNEPSYGRSVGSSGGYSFTKGVEGYFGTLGTETGPIAKQIAEIERQLAIPAKNDNDLQTQESLRNQLKRLKAAQGQASTYKQSQAGKDLVVKARNAEMMVDELKARLTSSGFYKSVVDGMNDLPAQPSTPEEIAAWRRFLDKADAMGRSPDVDDAQMRQVIANTDKVMSELYNAMKTGVGGA